MIRRFRKQSVLKNSRTWATKKIKGNFTVVNNFSKHRVYFPVANEDMIHSQHYALNSHTDAHQGKKKNLNFYLSQSGAGLSTNQQ